MRSNWLVVWLFVPILALASVQKQTLSNGLEVWTKEDKRAPVVNVQVWYDVGAKDEPRGLTGISHVLEHMMFMGTKRFPGNNYRQQMAEIGAAINAYTNQDETVYHVNAHKSHLPLILELEADRMRGIQITEKEFTKEMKVVNEERRRSYLDSPYGFLWDVVLRQTFMGGPYAAPVIGYKDDLDAMTYNDAIYWYNRYYHPNNARIIVVGDVKHSQVVEEVKKHFEKLPAANLPVRHTMQGPRIPLRNTVEIETELKIPNYFYVVKVPNYNENPKIANALRILSRVMSGSAHSALVQNLVKEKRKANDISASYLPWWKHESAFIINAEPAPGVNLNELGAAIEDQLLKLAREINDEMVKGALQGLKLSAASTMDYLEGQASYIGIASKYGIEPKEALSYRYDIEVTADDVTAALKSIINAETKLVINAYPKQRG